MVDVFSNVYKLKRKTRMTSFVSIFLFATICTLAYAGPEPSDSLGTRVNCVSEDTACIGYHIRMAKAMTSSDYPKALEHAVSAVRLSEKASNYTTVIESYKAAGGIAMYKGLFDLAVKYFTNHFDLAKSKGDDIEAGMAYHNLGALYIAVADYRKARKFLNDSYDMLQVGYRNIGQPVPEPTMLTYRMNTAITYIYLDEYQGADSMLNLSMDLLQGMPEDRSKMMTIHHLWGLLYLKIRQPIKAFEALSQSRALAIQLNNMPGVAATYITEGEVFEQTGDSLSAIISYTRGLGYARQYSGLSDQLTISEFLYKLYRKRGPTDSVVKYLDLFTDLKARSKAEQAKQELMRMELMRDYTQMVENWERNQQPAKQQRIYLWFALFLSLVSAFVIYVRYLNQQRKIRFERVRRDLEEKKTELEQRRLQAELNQQAAELDSLRAELGRQQLLEGLVGCLDPTKKIEYQQDIGKQDTIKGSATERKAKAWEEFEYRFQQLHSGFYDRLNQRFPGLTINERRLCAFLKLDMTTKEISDITGQSVRAVNMARIRLRNKLGLTHTDTELFAFLSEH